MDISDLRVLDAVSRHGSMNRAAHELHTVQSNVTARIRTLEQELGVPLFERHPRGVTTTAAGRRLLPYAARIMKLVADAQVAAKDDGIPSGTLHLGSLETTTAFRLSPALSKFATTYPKVRLVLTTGTTCALLEDVIECRLEGAFVAGPVAHPDLHQEVVFREELVLVTSRSITSPAALAEVSYLRTIVFQIGCSYRQRLDSFLTRMGIITAKPLEFGSLDAIINCVSAGIGVTLLPRVVVSRALKEGAVAVHELPRDQSQVDTLFVRRAESYVSSALSAFLESVRPRLTPRQEIPQAAE